MKRFLAPRRRPTRNSRGVSLIEAAIVAPVMLLIVFGIVELSFVFRSASVTTTASRSGARLAASTYGDTETAAQRTAVLAEIGLATGASLRDLQNGATPTRMIVYKADAAGLPESGTLSSCTSRCVEYSWVPATSIFVVTGGSGWSDPDNCGVIIDLVGVHVDVQHAVLGQVIDPIFDIGEKTVMRLEPGAFSVCPIE